MTTVFSQSMDGLCRALRELQTGFVLGSSDMNDLSVLNLRLPSGESGRLLPPGQGYYVRRGRFRQMKAATPHAGDLTLADWVERLANRRGSLVTAPGRGVGSAWKESSSP
jgi:S-DNA-T family DNA segregation ATPase FtsK/SpoIIIE